MNNKPHYITEFLPFEFTAKKRSYSEDDAVKLALQGIILGDIIGSKYELSPRFFEDIRKVELLGPGHSFTDDSVMTIATYEATKYLKKHKPIFEKKKIKAYRESYLKYGNRYPDAGYGESFYRWLHSSAPKPYSSFGNGAAMRAGIIGAMFSDVNDVIKYAYYSAMPSHNHPEGIKGACVTAVITWMILYGASKDDIKTYIKRMYPATEYKYINGEMTIDEVINRPLFTNNQICQRSVPEAFINLIYSNSYEKYIRNSFRYWCDRDTICAIAGGAAALFYGNIKLSNYKKEDIIEYYPEELKQII